MTLVGAADLPKLPEGQDSFAGIPKAVFVVSTYSKKLENLINFGIFYNQQNISDQMIFLFKFSLLISVEIVGWCRSIYGLAWK